MSDNEGLSQNNGLLIEEWHKNSLSFWERWHAEFS